MSAYSTLKITRSKARALVMEELFRGLNDDKLLESHLDRILENRLYNAVVCDDDDDLNDDAIISA